MDKRMIAPIVVTILIACALAFYAVVIAAAIPNIWLLVLGYVVIIALLGVAVAMCVQRIREIKSREEDDLDKY
jgi:uncharacterized membrane protein YhaH (DUF805 family)